MAVVTPIDVDFEKVDFDNLINMHNCIHKGDFGAVYGPFTWNSKMFAVKHNLFSQEGLDDCIKAVESRKTVWTSLKHEHLIEIHHVRLKPKELYLVMEYASGGSLRQLLDKPDVKDYYQMYISNWARQIAEGMLYLHSKELVHRNLNSNKVMLMEPFDSLNVRVVTTLKITDFDSVLGHAGTATISLNGTYAYMAPEVLMTERFSKASDVWSYGVVIWGMLTRELPHEGQTTESLVAKAQSEQLMLPMPESIPRVFKELLCDCWCYNTESRLPFKDIIDRLDSIPEIEYIREKMLATERKHEHERVAWSEEKAQLLKKIEVLQTLMWRDPVLLYTINTKAAEFGKKAIRGLTFLDKEMFVMRCKNSEVQVYNSMTFAFSHQWNLKELIDPVDLNSCSRNKCLYIFDHKGEGLSKEILRVGPNGNLIRNWSTGDDNGHGLSVTDEANVFLSVFNKNKLSEYSPDGNLIREINLSSDTGICHPRHAIKLTNGHFLLSHGYDGDDGDELHRVCVVDADGKLKKSFGGKSGSLMGQISYPHYMAVDRNGFVLVADRGNRRVVLLDPDLEFMKEILGRERHGLERLWSIFLDESNDRLFVTDNEFDSKKKMFRDGRILVFYFR